MAKISALLILTIFEHSSADLPVVITSYTIRTFEFFGIANPLLNINFFFSLSAKILLVFNCLATSYPTTIPPKAGDRTISILSNSDLIFSHNDEQINADFSG